MSQSSETRIDGQALQPFVTTLFKRCQMSDMDAALLAETLVEADLSGCIRTRFAGACLH